MRRMLDGDEFVQERSELLEHAKILMAAQAGAST